MYFPNGNGTPEIVYLTEPPKTRTFLGIDHSIEIELYTRRNARKPQNIILSNGWKQNMLHNFTQYFNSSKEIVFIVHGWKSNTQSDTVQHIKDEYLKRKNCNVFAVNWERLASNNFYLMPARDTKSVGRDLAAFLDFLIKEIGANPKKIHLIGHSLGAHIVGYAGSFLKTERVYRITGLDPAGPGFENMVGPEDRIDYTDGEFVDIIHTCAGVLGYKENLGHIDFYPNSGQCPQPGCEGLMEILQACSHGRSYQFFAESINTETGFIAYPCESWKSFKRNQCKNTNSAISVQMGDHVSRHLRGTFFLRTRSESPFAIETIA